MDIFHNSRLPFSKYFIELLFCNDSNTVKDELSNFGQELKILVTNKTFIDMGCGIPEISGNMNTISKLLEATNYIGIDNKIEKGYEVINTFTQCEYIESDLLNFVQNMDKSKGNIFFFSGIEPITLFQDDLLEKIKTEDYEEYKKDQITRAYIDNLLKEISLKSITGDIIIIGAGISGLNPDKYGYKKIIEKEINMTGYKQNSISIFIF
ncbi:MAG: hypothetical protein WCJ19_05535 [bacterium]